MRYLSLWIIFSLCVFPAKVFITSHPHGEHSLHSLRDKFIKKVLTSKLAHRYRNHFRHLKKWLHPPPMGVLPFYHSDDEELVENYHEPHQSYFMIKPVEPHHGELTNLKEHSRPNAPSDHDGSIYTQPHSLINSNREFNPMKNTYNQFSSKPRHHRDNSGEHGNVLHEMNIKNNRVPRSNENLPLNPKNGLPAIHTKYQNGNKLSLKNENRGITEDLLGNINSKVENSLSGKNISGKSSFVSFHTKNLSNQISKDKESSISRTRKKERDAETSTKPRIENNKATFIPIKFQPSRNHPIIFLESSEIVSTAVPNQDSLANNLLDHKIKDKRHKRRRRLYSGQLFDNDIKSHSGHEKLSRELQDKRKISYYMPPIRNYYVTKANIVESSNVLPFHNNATKVFANFDEHDIDENLIDKFESDELPVNDDGSIFFVDARFPIKGQSGKELEPKKILKVDNFESLGRKYIEDGGKFDLYRNKHRKNIQHYLSYIYPSEAKNGKKSSKKESRNGINGYRNGVFISKIMKEGMKVNKNGYKNANREEGETDNSEEGDDENESDEKGKMSSESESSEESNETYSFNSRRKSKDDSKCDSRKNLYYRTLRPTSLISSESKTSKPFKRKTKEENGINNPSNPRGFSWYSLGKYKSQVKNFRADKIKSRKVKSKQRKVKSLLGDRRAKSYEKRKEILDRLNFPQHLAKTSLMKSKKSTGNSRKRENEKFLSSPYVKDAHCHGNEEGIYADVEKGCQVFHMCQSDGRSSAFTCPGGTLFDEKHHICDHTYKVKCGGSV